MPEEPANQALVVKENIARLSLQLATNPDEKLRATLLKLLFEEREKEDRLHSVLLPTNRP